MNNLKKTALYNAHKKYGGKLIEFAGWELPVQYEGIIEEHNAVRNAAGLFDVSHMGEVEIKGPDVLSYIQNLITNDADVLVNKQVQYTLMCYPDGGVVDDLLVYRISSDDFLLVINAANVESDYAWMLKNKGHYDVSINNISNSISEVALQGPNAEKILQKLTSFYLSSIGFFRFENDIEISKIKCMVSRTGYTGEDGFEIYTSNESIETIWNNIMDAGHDYGIKPSGLGCRDTLRFEATLPLYGNEISKDITPLEAGLSFFVKLDKKDFIGKDALVNQKREGLKRKLAGLEMKDRGIPRHGYEVRAEGKKIGYVTTGYHSPTLNKNIGLALINSSYSKLGTEIEVVIRNRPLKAEVISKKFYSKKYRK